METATRLLGELLYNDRMRIHIHVHDESGNASVMAKVLTNTEEIMSRLNDLAREVAEMQASAAGVVERLSKAAEASRADAESAKQIAANLQSQVDAGNQELSDISAKAAELSSALNSKQTELDSIASDVQTIVPPSEDTPFVPVSTVPEPNPLDDPAAASKPFVFEPATGVTTEEGAAPSTESGLTEGGELGTLPTMPGTEDKL